MADTKDIKATIKKYGRCIQKTQGRIPGVWSVPCQSCGKPIRTDDKSLMGIEYSITRRGDACFWHSRCGIPWDSKIKWEAPDEKS